MTDAVKITRFHNLSIEELIAQAIAREEGRLSQNDALAVVTGKRTGRSPRDRYIVEDEQTKASVDWGAVNQPISPSAFERLWARATEHLAKRDVFTAELQVGSVAEHAVPVHVSTEFAWHNLFVRHLFVRPGPSNKSKQPAWSLMNAASLVLDPAHDGVNDDGAVIIHISQRKVLLCGMRYAGEMKKAMFSALNFILPQRDILPMHCAANQGFEGDVALFFGLSGTGKTTLSADPNRLLIGDDEHAWSSTGVFNFEGGCYAKCINLSPEREPVIWGAIKHGAIMENVVLDSHGLPDYTDSSLTSNTRCAYPLEHIAQRVEAGAGGHPRAVIFLTCDLYGVLPPVSILDLKQAAYYFLSGYTALVGSTEVGGPKGVQPTFSTCFGAPFFPRPAQVYANLLMKRVQETGCQVYLVNTGWTGGAYAEGGERFAINETRAIVTAIINQQIRTDEVDVLPHFNLKIPRVVPGVDAKVLNPRQTWADQSAYDEKSKDLITKFCDNFSRFDVAADILAAGPDAKNLEDK